MDDRASPLLIFCISIFLPLSHSKPYRRFCNMCIFYLLSIAQLKIFVSGYPYYRIVQEGDGNIQVCFQTNRIVTEPLYVHVETTFMDIAGNTSAIGKTNMILRILVHNIYSIYIDRFYIYSGAKKHVISIRCPRY